MTLVVLVTPVAIRRCRAFAVIVLAARGIGADVVGIGTKHTKGPPPHVPAFSTAIRLGDGAQVPVSLKGHDLGEI